MKKLLLVALVVAGGVIGYNHFLNPAPASADERVLSDLERRFDAASQQMAQATRSTGMSGLDTTADIEAARASVGRIEAELGRIEPTLTSQAARQRVDRLREKVKAFLGATG